MCPANTSIESAPVGKIDMVSTAVVDVNQSLKNRFSAIAPVPTSVEQTRLSVKLLKSLTLKHVFNEGVASIRCLAERLCLVGSVVETIVKLLREDALLELSVSRSSGAGVAFALTEQGRQAARDALERSGYLGPAPVPLSDYSAITEHFSLAKCKVGKRAVADLFSGFVIEQSLLDQLGSAFNSRQAIFVYGPAGCGKTYTIKKMAQLFGDACLIPHAVAVDESIIQLFDPQLHVRLPLDEEKDIIRFSETFDKRLIPCRRPIVIAGGELTADLLEVKFDTALKVFQAPLQMKANGGIFFIDDIGRQRVSPQLIFNRWIVPMEERRDYLSLNTGQHFEVPFDVQLVFSSNLDPRELADEAALRRIGFKIMFTHINPNDFHNIWIQELNKRGLTYDQKIVEHVLENLYANSDIALSPCHPRDLINIALTQEIYLRNTEGLSIECINWAWENYFVNTEKLNSLVNVRSI